MPALTTVKVELLATVGSGVSVAGDMFPIRLAAPIVLDAHEVVSAGAMGMAEVVHAKKARKKGLFTGDAPGGEFIAAARFIELNGERIQLRSLRLAGKGSDKTTKIIATVTMAIAFNEDEPGEADVLFSAGTIAEAKLAKSLQVPTSNCSVKP